MEPQVVGQRVRADHVRAPGERAEFWRVHLGQQPRYLVEADPRPRAVRDRQHGENLSDEGRDR